MAGTRRRGTRLARYSLVGAFGFVVDAAVVTALATGLGWHPYPARAVSFAAAVTATWLCHRRWVFAATASPGREYRHYVAVQLAGGALNLAAYAALIGVWAGLGRWPAVPLAVGSGIALAFNYAAARHFVFAERPPDATVDPAPR